MAWLQSSERGPLLRTAMALLFCCMPPTGALTNNEHVYFSHALKYFDPSRFGAYTGFLEHTFTRVLFDYPTGFLVATLGSTATQMLLRSLCILLLSFPMASLARRLGLTVMDLAAAIMAFNLLDQMILGGEWIFLSAESKVFAYVCVLWALAASWEGRFRVATLWCGLGIYLHYQVAGMWWLFMAVWLAVFQGKARDVAKAAPLFLLCCLPQAALLAHEYGADFLRAAPLVEGRSTNWIYSVFNIPMHVAPFATLGRFTIWAPGIAFLFSLTALTLWWRRRDILANRREDNLCALVLLGLVWLVGALPLSLLDAVWGDYSLGKLYLFRPSSLTLLLWLMLATREARRIGQRELTLAALTLLAPLFLTIGGAWALEPVWDRMEQARRQQAVVASLEASLTRDDVVLVDPELEEEFMHLDRDHGVSTWVNFRGVPTGSARVAAWYGRILERKRLFATACGGNATVPPPVARLLAKAQDRARLEGACGRVVHADEHYLVLDPRQSSAP